MGIAWIVTRDWYLGEELAEYIRQQFPGTEVITVYRDYHFREMVDDMDEANSPNVVITDGTCKARDEFESYAIYFDEPRQLARRLRIPAIIIPFSRIREWGIPGVPQKWIERFIRAVFRWQLRWHRHCLEA